MEIIEQFNLTDWVIVALFVISIIVGLYRGLIKELGTLVVWVAAFVLAMMFYEDFSVFLENYISDPRILKFVSIIILILAVIFVGGLLNMLLGYLVKSSGLGGIDKLFGGVFGFLRAGVLIGLAAVAVTMLNMSDNDYIKESRLLSEIKPYGDWVYDLIPAEQRTWIEDNVVKLDATAVSPEESTTVTVTSADSATVTVPAVTAGGETTTVTATMSIEGEPLPEQTKTIFDLLPSSN